MSIQEALRLMRYELGMTQTDLAKELNRSKLSVVRWENGHDFPSRANACSIISVAKKHGVSNICLTYLEDVLMPESKRNKTASEYGFPEIDRELLFQIADDSSDIIYVIEADTYKLLYANKKAEKSAVRFITETGTPVTHRQLKNETDRRCYHFFGGKNSPCDFCPLEKFNSENYQNVDVIVPPGNRKLRVHAKKMAMRGKQVYVIYLTDITDADAERMAIYKLTNNIPEGIGIYNLYNDGSIHLAFMNEHLFKMFGEARREMLRTSGKTDLCLIHKDDKPILLQEIEASGKNSSNVNVNLRMKFDDQKYHLVNICANIINHDTEKRTFYCIFQQKD